MLKNNFCVFDLECGSTDAQTTDMLQISAQVFDNATLKPVDGGYFTSFSRPNLTDEQILSESPIQSGALLVNHIRRQDILTFPDEKIVWSNFVDFCLSHRVGKTNYGNVIPVGYNIIRYDLIIIDRLIEKYKSKQVFAKIHSIDLMNLTYCWMESLPDIEKFGFDYIKEYMGLHDPNFEFPAHDSRADIHYEGLYFVRLLENMRLKAKKMNFKGAFSPKAAKP